MGAHGRAPGSTPEHEALTVRPVKVSRYVPTLPQIAQEALATLAGALLVAWLVRNSETLQRLTSFKPAGSSSDSFPL